VHFNQHVLIINVNQQFQIVKKLEKNHVKEYKDFVDGQDLEKENVLKKDVVLELQNVLEKNVKKTFHKCTWKGLLKCKTFNFSCKLKSYKKTHKRLQCCKKERLCYGKRCKTKIVFCRWKGESHFFREKKKFVKCYQLNKINMF